MQISPLIEAKTELTDGGLNPEPIVLSSRIRIARNIRGYHFPGWASKETREQLLNFCTRKLHKIPGIRGGIDLKMENLTSLEKEVLVERRLVSRELTENFEGSGVLIANDQRLSLMINEEDHLRIQVVRSGFNLRKTWEEINQLDTAIESVLDYAYSDNFGYLTACPTNIGTGIRASAMLHLPGLVMQDYMDKVVRMVNQLGMAVRGSFGEGSEAMGSIFQISNQQTLGESEEDILGRLINVLHAIIKQEENARSVLLESKRDKLLDKIGRAYGVLQNGHLLSSDESVNMLSLMRLAVDLGFLPDDYRGQIDRLMMDIQPGHVKYISNGEVEPSERDRIRATRIREQFASFPKLSYKKVLPRKN